MAGLGTLPILVTTSHVAFPLWWNDCQFPLVLTGMLGTVLLGVAAKGVDQHSTVEQMKAASLEKEVAVVVKTADAAPAPVKEVEVVAPSKTPEIPKP